MSYSKWNIPLEAPEIPGALLGAGFSPLLAAVLWKRGLHTPEEAQQFLDADETLLGDPFALEDMQKAVDRLRQAIETRETVAVYGDYDVDGITSTCMITDYLRSKGVRCHPYIPNRLEEGYGVNCDAIRGLCEQRVTLIVTVDCGVTAIEEAGFAASTLGVDMIITDHHECQETLPAAVAIIDPKRPDCSYPSHDLAGVGVAFKLLCALEGGAASVLDRYADLVAVGTIADVMPLIGENRYIVKRGLEKLNNDPRPGLQALIEESGFWSRGERRRITATNIGFTIAPRINASGRLGQAECSMDLLLSRNLAEAQRYAATLCQLNRDRQDLEADIWQDALTMLGDEAPDGPIVLAHADWHQGVIGIAASRLAEKFSVPAIMICLDGEDGKGSCRSSGGFNLFAALNACSGHLEGFGGHALAAGLTIRRENIDAFRAAFAAYYRDHAEECVSTLDIDLCVNSPVLLTLESVEDLDRMEPFGTGNQRPRLALLGAHLSELTPIGRERHLRITLEKDGAIYDAVYFNHTAAALGLHAGDCVDAAFYPQINEFRDRRSVQLLICDIRRHDAAAAAAMLRGEYPASPVELPREDFTTLWRALEARGGAFRAPLYRFCADLCPALAEDTLCLCLKVFEELGLVRLSLADDNCAIERIPDVKARLDDSALLARLRRGEA